MIKLNLGCGNAHMEGWVNVDKEPGCNPEVLWNIENVPWPWDDNSVDEVMLSHVLEHIGVTADGYFTVLKELYRVCKHDAKVYVFVPHPRHDDYLGDPTHVRPITVGGFDLISKKNCDKFKELGAANTPLAHYLGIDFEIEKASVSLDEPWKTRFEKGEIPMDQLKYTLATYNNVAKRSEFILKVVKEYKQLVIDILPNC